MNTVTTEIEAILNSHLLTNIDAEDIDEGLTPVHFMYGKRLLTIPDVDLTLEEEDDHCVHTRRKAYLITTSCHYFRRWKEEHLFELKKHHNLLATSRPLKPARF